MADAALDEEQTSQGCVLYSIEAGHYREIPEKDKVRNECTNRLCFC